MHSMDYYFTAKKENLCELVGNFSFVMKYFYGTFAIFLENTPILFLFDPKH